MKKFLSLLALLLMLPGAAIAQSHKAGDVNEDRYVDISDGGTLVASVPCADVDKITVADGKVSFHKGDEIIHQTPLSSIGYAVVYDGTDEPNVYLGIIGFNQALYEKQIGLLTPSTVSDYKSFVSGLTSKYGTLLYYAADNGLDRLSAYDFVGALKSVNLITFTDGLDQGSHSLVDTWQTDDRYLSHLAQRVKDTRVAGLPLTAYSLGLRGSDVTDYTQFKANLRQLASADTYAYEVSSMSDVNTRLSGIADDIISRSTTQRLSVTIPIPGNGTRVRIVLDGKTATASAMYIDGTFQLSERKLTGVTFHGLTSQDTDALDEVRGVQDGIFVTFTFDAIVSASTIATSGIRQYNMSSGSTTWQINSEFDPAANSTTEVTHYGTAVFLLLDCSSSLGSDFSNMKSYANNFIQQVANNTADPVKRPFGMKEPFNNTPKTFTANGINFKMMPVEGGTFQMGSTAGDSDEKPVHEVTLDGFHIGQTEVTQELWQAVMGSNPSYFTSSAKLPVEKVSWNDCQSFITKLNELTGQSFRLPTEAEWEYAARGGNLSKGYTYSGSDNIDDVAWYTSNSSSKTHEVATKAPNELGIYDMSGNVWEWCQDWYGSSYYSSSVINNPTGPSSGSYRVYRGGSWLDDAAYCRCANRVNGTPTLTYSDLGFRLAL